MDNNVSPGFKLHRIHRALHPGLEWCIFHMSLVGLADSTIFLDSSLDGSS